MAASKLKQGGLAGKTILVTGCTGFIGAHVVIHLLRLEKEKGETVFVRGTVRRPGDSDKLVQLFEDIGWLARFSEHVLDITSEEKWDDVCSGCDIIMHVASPVSLVNSDNDIDSVLKPALTGTFNVMKAAARSGSVKKVVVTSSAAAVASHWSPSSDKNFFYEHDFTEMWDPACSVYGRSKTASELSAWLFASKPVIPREDIIQRLMPPGSDAHAVQGGEWLQSKVKEIEGMFAGEDVKESQLDVVTVNPVIVLGEVLLEKHSGHIGSSADMLLQQMVDPFQYGQPPIALANVDILDVARLHIVAARESKLSGRRIFAVASYLKYADFGSIIRKHFPGFGPTLIFTWPQIVGTMIIHIPFLNKKIPGLRWRMERTRRGVGFDTALAKELLGSFEPVDATIKSGGDSFIKLGLAKKKPKVGGSSTILITATCVGIVAATTIVLFRTVSINK